MSESLISICDQYDVATVGDLYGMAIFQSLHR